MSETSHEQHRTVGAALSWLSELELRAVLRSVKLDPETRVTACNCHELAVVVAARLTTRDQESLGAILPDLEYKGDAPIPVGRLSTRARNVLASNNIRTVRQLAQLSPGQIFALPSVGAKTRLEIVSVAVRIHLEAHVTEVGGRPEPPVGPRHPPPTHMVDETQPPTTSLSQSFERLGKLEVARTLESAGIRPSSTTSDNYSFTIARVLRELVEKRAGVPLQDQLPGLAQGGSAEIPVSELSRRTRNVLSRAPIATCGGL